VYIFHTLLHAVLSLRMLKIIGRGVLVSLFTLFVLLWTDGMRVRLSARKPGLNPKWLLSLTVPRRHPHLSLNLWLFHVLYIWVFCVLFLSIYIVMLFLCLGCVLFGWLSAAYVVFPACTISFHLLFSHS